MEASKGYIFAGVILPDALSYITAGLRTGVSITLVVILEMFIGPDKGLVEMDGTINHHQSHRVWIG